MWDMWEYVGEGTVRQAVEGILKKGFSIIALIVDPNHLAVFTLDVLHKVTASGTQPEAVK